MGILQGNAQKLVDAHNADPGAHPALAADVVTAVADSAAALAAATAALAAVGAGAPIAFRADGYYRVADGIDVIEPLAPFTIGAVILRRTIAGTGGTTEIDVLKNGSTIFTTPANRPKILASAGNNARSVSVAPDIPGVLAGDRLEIRILTVEDGDPQDLVAILEPT
jgi:hypothetical protein